MRITSENQSDQASLTVLTPLELEQAIPGAHHFSLWLIPCKNDHDLLAEIIKKLADEHDAPVFEPHMTIYTGVYTPKDTLEMFVAEPRGMVQPISLTVQRIGYSDNFFRTLFIQFQDDPILTALSQRLRSRLQYQAQYDLRPHLSLLYKRIPEEQKRVIIDRLNFVKPQVRFDGIAAVSPGNPSRGWIDVENWETRFRRSLVGSV